MKHSNLTNFVGVIEKNPELFKPRLPKEKTNSMQKMVFGTVNKIFIAYEKPFLHPDITEVDFIALLIQLTIIVIFKVITLWNPVDEKVVPMEDRWYRKIYSFCKGSKTTIHCFIFLI